MAKKFKDFVAHERIQKGSSQGKKPNTSTMNKHKRRQTGVKISAANAFLKESTAKGTVKKVGGYAGHHLYQVVSS